MAADYQQPSPHLPRSRWPLIGKTCFAWLALGGYSALVGYGLWQSGIRHRIERPISTNLEVALPILTIAPGDIVTSHQLEAVGAALSARLKSPSDPKNVDRVVQNFPVEDSKAAAEFAALSANQVCLRNWNRAPFGPDMYSATFQNGRWHWGRDDPIGPIGFSAEVSFRQDGSAVYVQIHFTTDLLNWSESQGKGERSPTVPDAFEP